MRAGRIAIIHAGHRDLWSSAYGMRGIGDALRAEGRSVFVVGIGDAFQPAAAAVLHVDRTVVPAAYLALARRYPVVVNGRVRDIGKRVFGGPLAATRDYAGPVIVKTNRNCGGQPELDAARRRGGLARIWAGVLGRLPVPLAGVLRPERYPVYASGRAAPAWYFHDPRFVVQRLLPERHGDRFALRRWTFLGDRELHSMTFSAHPVIKSGTLKERTELGAAPPALHELRRRLGFEYGKFDYGIIDGEVVIYDVNRTPHGGNLAAGELEQLGRALAPGLDAAVERSAVTARPGPRRVAPR